MPIALRGKALERLRARDAREKATEERAVARCEKNARQRGDRAAFERLIDISGGPGACHLWCGATDVNHRESNQPGFKRYLVGHFEMAPYGKQFAHRLRVMLECGIDFIPRDTDIAPTCGEHLCMNMDHLVVREHGGGQDRIDKSIPVREYFASEAVRTAALASLERAADTLLAGVAQG